MNKQFNKTINLWTVLKAMGQGDRLDLTAHINNKSSDEVSFFKSGEKKPLVTIHCGGEENAKNSLAEFKEKQNNVSLEREIQAKLSEQNMRSDQIGRAFGNQGNLQIFYKGSCVESILLKGFIDREQKALQALQVISHDAQIKSLSTLEAPKVTHG